MGYLLVEFDDGVCGVDGVCATAGGLGADGGFDIVAASAGDPGTRPFVGVRGCRLNDEIARRCGVESDTVRRWRSRFMTWQSSRVPAGSRRAATASPVCTTGTHEEELRLTYRESPARLVDALVGALDGGSREWRSPTIRRPRFGPITTSNRGCIDTIKVGNRGRGSRRYSLTSLACHFIHRRELWWSLSTRRPSGQALVSTHRSQAKLSTRGVSIADDCQPHGEGISTSGKGLAKLISPPIEWPAVDPIHVRRAP